MSLSFRSILTRLFGCGGTDPFGGLTMLNLEPSYVCNLDCLMCQRHARAHKQGVMSMGSFMRLQPYFHKFQNVVLTGVGEPTINAQLPEMVRLVSEAGAKPCMTTNGTLLNEAMIRALLEGGLAHCTFSIDGGTRETYERIRVGAKWEEVLGNARLFNEMRRTVGGKCPDGTMWAYVLMRDNFRELPAAVRLAAECGFTALHTNYIAINVVEYEREQMLHSPDGELLPDVAQELTQILQEAQEEAQRCGISFVHLPYTMPSEVFGCQAEPTKSVFVDWMGNVSPCCLRPVRSDAPDNPDFLFGDIQEHTLEQILRSDRFRRFRAEWSAHKIPDVCKTCYMTHRINRDFFEQESVGCGGCCCGG